MRPARYPLGNLRVRLQRLRCLRQLPSTGHLVFPDWVCDGKCSTIWLWRPTRRRSPCWWPPQKACLNLQRLSGGGFEGAYGMYEAIDYTKSRLLAGQPYAIVQSFMAHHQAMSFLSIVSQSLDSPMQKRFESIPMVRATNLLLEERSPRPTFLYSQAIDMPEKRIITKAAKIQFPLFQHLPNPDTRSPLAFKRDVPCDGHQCGGRL